MWESVILPTLYAVVLAFWSLTGGILVAARQQGRLDLRTRATLATFSPLWVQYLVGYSAHAFTTRRRRPDHTSKESNR